MFSSSQRRPDGLASYVDMLRAGGTAVEMVADVFQLSNAETDFRTFLRKYVQLDDIGRAYEVGSGLQTRRRGAKMQWPRMLKS